MEAAVRAEPLAEVVKYRFPSNRWRRYDRLTHMPDGLIVVGDAMCSFNPTYGQGMSVAATEAVVLRQCLQRGDHYLPQRFFRAAAKAIRVAWQTAVSWDLTLPQIEGHRPLPMQITNAYLDRVLAAAETDPAVMQRFLRLISMVDPPSRLVSLPMLLRLARGDKKRRGRHA
ncbi:hypothetical protein [Mycobacterium sp. E2327]|uniref:hypothetical protein n=1 Tax=Mycobacterium sp. E2327 TaxID=1834132 RepID=UPI000B12D0CC|nr:hypothetical protein [Mycobacterium sp. E2327]